MSDSIFGNPEKESQDSAKETPEQKEATAQPVAASQQEEVKQPADPYTDLLNKIQAPDGHQKFASVDAALNSIPHAQDHIKQLTDKVRDLESALKEKSNVEEILHELKSKQAKVEQPSTQGLSEEQLVTLFDRQFAAREQAKLQKANQQSVVKALVESFGDKAEAAYLAKAEEYGVDVSILNDLASRSPKAVLAYFGVSGNTSPTLSKSSVNTAAMANAPKQERDPMAIFKTAESDLVKKWRESVSKIEG